MTLVAPLKRLLESRGVSPAEAAQLAGMTKQQAWKILTGKSLNPGYFTVQRIVEAIGCTMAELAEAVEEERRKGEAKRRGRPPKDKPSPPKPHT